MLNNRKFQLQNLKATVQYLECIPCLHKSFNLEVKFSASLVGRIRLPGDPN